MLLVAAPFSFKSTLNILFVTSNYPSQAQPYRGTFVREFVWAMARQGHQCDLVAPTSIFSIRYGAYPGRLDVEQAGHASSVCVHRPLYVSYSSRDLGVVHTGAMTNLSFQRTAIRAARFVQDGPSLVYGHFLYPSGRTAVKLGERLRIPCVLGVGEGTFWTVEPVGFDRAKRDFRKVTGVLAVSSLIKRRLIDELDIPPDKIRVFPNGVDLGRFRQAPRHQVRERYGVRNNTIAVAYVGGFKSEKGVSVLDDAVRGLDGIAALFVGSGSCVPTSPNIVFRQALPHADIPGVLSAADVFVMPSLAEGSCNAVIEAMACGLPIVTSNGRYMDDIVDDEVAIRVDPTDVRAIREAILLLKNDPVLRRRMSEACLKKARQFDINDRARRVTAWMEELVQRYHS